MGEGVAKMGKGWERIIVRGIIVKNGPIIYITDKSKKFGRGVCFGILLNIFVRITSFTRINVMLNKNQNVEIRRYIFFRINRLLIEICLSYDIEVMFKIQKHCISSMIMGHIEKISPTK